VALIKQISNEPKLLCLAAAKANDWVLLQNENAMAINTVIEEAYNEI